MDGNLDRTVTGNIMRKARCAEKAAIFLSRNAAISRQHTCNRPSLPLD